MSRILSISILVLLSLLPSLALAAPVHARHATHWRYGFLPGYHQPPSNAAPVYGMNRSAPAYTPGYWYNGTRYYFGRPGFLHGRYNGGSFGPCWTWTPAGRVWTCG